MKKTKKALASLAIASMALTMVPFNAFASGTVPPRLSGTTAAQTAVAIADQTGWTGTAILASSASYGMVDALTAGPLASYLKAPILLTGAGSALDVDTKAELTKLNVKTVYVTSGTAVIKQSVLDELTGMGITVVPLGGKDRAETSVNIAAKMPAATKVVIANGLQDALSIAAIASAANAPILLTDKDKLPDSVAGFLAANPGITSSDVIGGTGIISDAVKAKLPGATRHAGNSAYDTNNQVIQDFASSLKFDNVFVANGVTGIDALAGAPLAALTKSAIVLTDGTVPAAATFVSGKLAAGSVVTALGGAAVVSDAVVTGVKTGVVTPPTGTLSVTSVSAVSATSFKVVFNQAPADTSKVTFAVARTTTPVTTTTTWNTAKTEATVTSSQNLPEGSYTVAVKNGDIALGTTTVAVTQQKIGKINITSTRLAVVSSPTNITTSGSIGYATYNVLDQYGNDITQASLANNVTFQTGAGDVTKPSKGILKITPTGSMSLIQLGQVIITGYDSDSGVSTTNTLTVSTALGTLSDITLGALTNADNKVLTGGDTSSVFYLGYTAKDVSGNSTNSYDLVHGGLVLSTSPSDGLTVSASNYVQARVIADPTDSNKAVIEVKVIAGNDMTMDLPVTMTAMTLTGKTSTVNVTLKKPASVDTFSLMAPAYDIAVKESKQIPFSAYDQNGIAMTKYNDLAIGTNKVNLSNNAYWDQNADGTAKVMLKSQDSKGPQVITATTSTGKFSSITINIQDAAVASTLSLDTSVLISAMQPNAVQNIDYGLNYGGLVVKDQYGRSMNMMNWNSAYQVTATTSGAISATGTAAGAGAISLTAGAVGSGTVTFNLVRKDTPSVVIDSKSMTFSNLAPTDIKAYTLDKVENAIYTTTSGAVTFRDDAYAANPCLYGQTAGGSKVVMAGNVITNVYLDNNDDFGTELVGNGGSPIGSYDSIYVYAKKLLNNVTEASTNVTVVFRDADGALKSLSTPIKSSSVAPTAKTIGVAVQPYFTGVSQDGDTVTIDATAYANYFNGKYMTRFTELGAKNRAGVFFYALDQYGTKGLPLAQVAVSSVWTTAGVKIDSPTFTLDANGMISGAYTPGTYALVTGITNNGLSKTVKIIFQ